MSDFFGKIKSGAGKVAFEADKLNRLNRSKGELERIKSQIQAQYAKLGEMYYTQRGSAGVTGPGYDEICQAIADLEQKSDAKNEEVKRINSEVYAPQAAQPAPQPASGFTQPAPTAAPTQTPQQPAQAPAQAMTKFCPNCGKELAVEAKFCTDCGTKV